MNIVLYGLRGTGKTTIGQTLAKKLNRKLIDIDEARLKKFGQTTDEVVKQGGWPLFRQQEKQTTLEIVSNFDNIVIAAGGGTLMDTESASALKKNGKAILLFAEPIIMSQRVLQDEKSKGINRPSLTGKKPEEEVAEVWSQRKDTYLPLADLIIDTGKLSIDEAVDKIINFAR